MPASWQAKVTDFKHDILIDVQGGEGAYVPAAQRPETRFVPSLLEEFLTVVDMVSEAREKPWQMLYDLLNEASDGTALDPLAMVQALISGVAMLYLR